MENFRGYYLNINGCNFTNPAIKREGYKCNPRIVQVTDAGRTASGKLIMKELPHKPTKISVTFPALTQEQFRAYCSAIRGGADEMYLNVEYWDDEVGNYRSGTFYHTDIVYQPVAYNHQMMIIMSEISFIEH